MQAIALSAHDGGTGDGRAATGKAEGKPVDYGARAQRWIESGGRMATLYMRTDHGYGQGIQAWIDGESDGWRWV